MRSDATPLGARPSRPVARAVGFALLAFVLTAVAGGVWTALLAVNLATTPAIPWSVAVMAALLWGLWAYLGGAGWPHRTSATRRASLRARATSRPVFVWALVAGLLAVVALAGLWIVLFHVANTAPRALPDYSVYPLVTVALALIMSSLVNAVAEEAAFRGYLQGVLEGSIGGVAAIAITTLVMAPEHALTQGFVWPTLVFYVFVDVMLGASAYLAQSIVPGIVTHAIGLLVFFTLVWPGDRIQQFIGQGDADTWLWIHAAQVVIFAALAVFAFARLARETRAQRR